AVVQASDVPSEADANAEDTAAEDSATANADETAGENAADTNEPELKESRMVIIGNSSFATDGLFSQQLNGDVFLTR
ncbi:MAG: ABC transporter, partial [Cyanobacteria bacterium J06553_1]